MLKKLSLIVITLTLTTSCVSKKIYTDLENKYADLKKENLQLSDDNATLTESLNKAQNDLAKLQKDYEDAVAQRDRLQSDYDATKTSLENLKASYDALEKNSSTAIAENSKKNRELLAQLEAKEQALAAENARLEALKKELEDLLLYS